MRVKYLDISQTCFRSFLFTVQFTFFNRVEKFWILEFSCTSFRELPFSFLFVCSSHKVCFARWLPSVHWGKRRAKVTVCFSSLRSRAPRNWILSYHKICCVYFFQKTTPKNKATDSCSEAIYQSYCSWEGEGCPGWGGLGVESVPTSKNPKVHLHSVRSANPLIDSQSISFCIVFTYIYSYIEQSSTGLLEFFFCFFGD